MGLGGLGSLLGGGGMGKLMRSMGGFK
jgi:hypothetical protein